MADKPEDPCDNKQVPEIRQIPTLCLRKIITILFAWDWDKDGYAGYDDIMNTADRFIHVGDMNEKSADNVIEFFRDLTKRTSYNPVVEIVNVTSLSEQIEGLWRAKSNPAALKSLGQIYIHMFQIIDVNAKGFLTFDEYLVFWNAFDLDKRFARMQFDFIDTNQDGKISEEEFVKAHEDYLVNTNDDTLNRFYGPLINY
ncbi:unnamed protein product [Owenia fusiformis]|uniref:Uncharacterized protein n=1 Tax=Owenia fusiformis TaxID=6347 RepID=A0A8J1U9Y4_OWEFU|nr:unnamed protein product [Owenia fusiformis]